MFQKSVHVGKWISEEILGESFSECDISAHEFCQMINHNDNPIALY